jgi:hypothetical protein
MVLLIRTDCFRCWSSSIILPEYMESPFGGRNCTLDLLLLVFGFICRFGNRKLSQWRSFAVKLHIEDFGEFILRSIHYE